MDFTDPDTKRDVDRIIEAFVYLYTESRRDTKELARAHGLTGPQVTALKLLQSVGDLSLSALSAKMQARNSTITGIVARMRKQGLVERVRDERDRRVVKIRLTEAGQALAEDIPVEPMRMFARVLGALSDEDRRALLRIVGSMSDHVRELVNHGSPDQPAGDAGGDD